MNRNNPFLKACTNYNGKTQGLKPDQWISKSNNGN